MKKLILAGAGHAHLVTIMNIGRFVSAGYSVTVIGPGDYHYYSGMGPGLLSGLYQPAETRFHVRRMTESRGGEFIGAHVVRINAHNNRLVLLDGRSIDYDVLSCNLGSEVVPVSGSNVQIISVKPIENLFFAGREIEERLKKESVRALVIGGGAAGIELAGNLWRLGNKTEGSLEITLVSQSEILARHHYRLRLLVLSSFAKRGIRIMEHVKVRELYDGEAVLHDGSRLAFDFAFNAAGIRPSPVFRNSGLPVAADGGLLVNACLQSVEYPNIFGGGDCISFVPRPLDRVGVYAVQQGQVLYEDVSALLGGQTLRAFKPQSHYLSILNMGDKTGLLVWRSFVFSGRFAFLLKNYIDKKFVNRFQVSGESNSCL